MTGSAGWVQAARTATQHATTATALVVVITGRTVRILPRRRTGQNDQSCVYSSLSPASSPSVRHSSRTFRNAIEPRPYVPPRAIRGDAWPSLL